MTVRWTGRRLSITFWRVGQSSSSYGCYFRLSENNESWIIEPNSFRLPVNNDFLNRETELVFQASQLRTIAIRHPTRQFYIEIPHICYKPRSRRNPFAIDGDRKFGRKRELLVLARYYLFDFDNGINHRRLVGALASHLVSEGWAISYLEISRLGKDSNSCYQSGQTITWR